MQTNFPSIALSVLLALGSGTVMAAGNSRTMPDRDPPQWHTEDTSPQMHYQTSKKEAGAAYQEARNDCKKLHGIAASDCNKEARSNFENDMARAKQMLRH